MVPGLRVAEGLENGYGERWRRIFCCAYRFSADLTRRGRKYGAAVQILMVILLGEYRLKLVWLGRRHKGVRFGGVDADEKFPKGSDETVDGQHFWWGKTSSKSTYGTVPVLSL